MAAKEDAVQLPTALFKGLSLKPSIVNRDFNSAQLCSNFEKKDNGQGTIRRGTNCFYRQDINGTDLLRALFPFTYEFHTQNTALNKELLAIGMGLDAGFAARPLKLYQLAEQTLTITYAGAGSAFISILPALKFNDYNEWAVTVTANGIEVFSDEYAGANDVTGSLDEFIQDIDGLANFACSPASLGTTAAASFIDVLGAHENTQITAGGTTFTYYDTVEIGEGEAAPKVFTDADFILPCAINYGNIIYFAYGANEYKYDGLDFYRSGLPQATINAVADAAGGTAFGIGETYIYKLIYSRVDYRGNVIEGEDSDDTLAVATHTMVANRDIDLTINNLIPGTYPNFALKGAKVNGAQAGVTTVTVDAAHTIEVGDVIYFFDGITSSYVNRTVTAIAATTITFAGAVNVADNIFISNNVRIQIWRTTNGGTDFYFIDEIPNDALNATQVYTDNNVDADLIEPFIEQIRKHSLPPKCSFLTVHQGLKMSAGDPENPNRVSWALPEDIEGYPAESNSTDVKFGGAGAVTAFGTIGKEEFAVFKEFGHSVYEGVFDDLAITPRDRTNTGIGCTSFRSIAYIGDNNALVGVSRKGVFIFNDGSPSLAIGNSIDPLFDQKQTPQVNGTAVPDSGFNAYLATLFNSDIERVLKRAVAINDILNGHYHLYLPAEVGIPGQRKIPVFTSSKYLVFDYDADVPFWTDYTFYSRYRDVAFNIQGRNVNAACGFTIYNDVVHFGMLSLRSSSDQVVPMLFRYNNNGSMLDYIEAAYPVVLDIHYTPFTRELGVSKALFKSLWVNLYKFLSDILADINYTDGLGSDFTFRIRTIKDYKNYPDPVYVTNVVKTFKVEDGATVVPTKCITDKARAFQIQLTTEDALPEDFEQILFDALELVYSMPYDKKQKDPKGTNG